MSKSKFADPDYCANVPLSEIVEMLEKLKRRQEELWGRVQDFQPKTKAVSVPETWAKDFIKQSDELKKQHDEIMQEIRDDREAFNAKQQARLASIAETEQISATRPARIPDSKEHWE